MSKCHEMRGAIIQAIELFEIDPPDSQFQRGYLAAVTWMARVLELDRSLIERAENVFANAELIRQHLHRTMATH